jgi:1-acyl-sn-glycerol-3-phosphate acyltransferase
MDTIYFFTYKLVAFTIRLILRFNGGLAIKGTENVPAEGGVIIASNHISYLDPPLLGSVLPRVATFMARKGLFDIPVLGRMITRAAFPIDREKPRPSTIKNAVRRLKKGALIVMFPEGRRNETGQLLEARRGVGMIATISNVPIVPALITGTDKALPVDAKWLKRNKISVIFGKPIYHKSFTESIDSPPHIKHDKISDNVMSAIKELQKKYKDTGK